MAFRLFTCVLIVVCGGLTGYELRRRLSIRLRSIEMIRDYLRDVRAYISHTGMSLDDIAISLDNGACRNSLLILSRVLLGSETAFILPYRLAPSAGSLKAALSFCSLHRICKLYIYYIIEIIFCQAFQIFFTIY